MGEYEPNDSRNVTGTAQTPDGRWSGDKQKGSGEYEPNDSRNVTGMAATRDGRWTNTEGGPPLAAGDDESAESAESEEEDDDDDDEPVSFEPDAELEAKIRQGQPD